MSWPCGTASSLCGARGLFFGSGHVHAQDLVEGLGLTPTGMLQVVFLCYNITGEVPRATDVHAAAGD
jgi:hypothetical protein